MVSISIMKLNKHTFFETGFAINNKPPLKNGNNYASLGHIVPEI